MIKQTDILKIRIKLLAKKKHADALVRPKNLVRNKIWLIIFIFTIKSSEILVVKFFNPLADKHFGFILNIIDNSSTNIFP